MTNLSLITPAEKSKAAEFLGSTRDNLFHAVSDLSASEWVFKPAPDCWSTLEILEHLVLIEDRVHAIINGMPEAPAAAPDHPTSSMDERIISQVPLRASRFSASPAVVPSGQWTPEQALDRFLESRAQTLMLLDLAPALRGHVLPHPIFGPWDGYQWILAAAAHSARHTNQIVEQNRNHRGAEEIHAVHAAHL